MAPLATAFVRIRSDSSLLLGDVRRDATRAGTTGGTVMGREFGAAFRRTTRVLVGLGIGTFAVQAGRFAIDMADKFELSRSRLETVTKNLGGSFSAIDSQVQALDNRLAAFGFTNADVEGSVASLESATKSSTKAMQDAALAADIARGRNISLESATQILMRVETGHVAMLSRLGIATKDANGHLLTQKEALAQLAQLYGGSASHYAGTFAGKQQALRAELGNTASAIGVALLPAAVDLAHVLQSDVLPPLEHAAQFFDRNRKTIEPLVGWVIKLTLAYKALKFAQKLSGGLSVGRAAATGGAGALATEAFSIAHPLPVFVVNSGGGGLPPVITSGGRAAAAGEVAAETSAGAAIGAGMAANLGRGALILSRALQAIKFAPLAFVGAQSDVHGNALGDAGSQALAAVNKIRGQAGQNAVALKPFVDALDKAGLFKIDTKSASGQAAAQKILQQVAASFLPVIHNEKALSAAAGDTTRTVQDQAKALGNLQTRSAALSQGQDDLRTAIHNMAVVAGQQSSRALRGNSDAAIANRDAYRGAVTQAENYLTLLKQHGASARTVANYELGLARALKRSADQTYGDAGAVDQLAKQLGFLPSQIQNIAAALNAAHDAAGLQISAGAAEAYGGLNAPGMRNKAKQAGDNLWKLFVSGATPVISKGVSSALNTATQKAATDAQAITGFFTQSKQSLISAFASISTATATDSLGGSYNKATSVRLQIRQAAQKMGQFARLYGKLEDLHYPQLLLDQFTSPDYIPAMQELLRGGRKEARQIRREFGSITRSAGAVAQLQTDDKYGRLVHEDIVSLPPKIEKGFERALKRSGVSLIEIDKREGRKVRAGG